MAPTKRKRILTRPKSNKRPKHQPLSEQEYKAECILDERILHGVRKYRVKWTDIDAQTGRAYVPTWEPVEALNEALIASWEEDKERRGGASISERPEPKKQRGRPRKIQTAQRHSRNSRVVESSPDASRVRPSSSPSTASTSARDSVVEALRSSAVTTPIDAPASPNHLSPRVQVNRRGSSLERGAYDPHSQIPPSPFASSQLHTQETGLGSPKFFNPAHPYSSGVVPDSQSTASDASFVPATQQTVDTFLRSTSTDNSEEEELTEDSGLLEIIQEAKSRAISPIASIPETIAETVGNSQSQRQVAKAKHLRHKLDTFDPIKSSSQAEADQSQADFQDEPPVTVDSVNEWQALSTAPASEQRASNPVQEASISLDSHQKESEVFASQEIVSFDLVDASFAFGGDAREANIANVLNRSSGHTQPIASSLIEASLAEPSTSQQNAQFPFHSQQAIHTGSTTQTSTNHSIQQTHLETEEQQTTIAENLSNQIEHRHTAQPCVKVADSVIIPESSHSKFSPAEHQATYSILQLPEQYDDLLNEFLVPEYGRSPSPVVQNQQSAPVQAIQTIAQSIEICPSGESSTHLLESSLTTESSEHQEQNAQVILPEADLSTENSTESIRPTIEKEYSTHRDSSGSRHDSSQETPERHLKSTSQSSSPIPPPPSHSVGTSDSRIPVRPTTPVLASSPSTMTGRSVADEVARELKEALEKKKAENPFTPRKPIFKSPYTPYGSASASVPPDDTLAPPLTSARKLFQANESSGAALDGTRSPSTVPDRSPALQIPTSLRTVALVPTSDVPASLSHDEDPAMPPDAEPESANIDAMDAAGDMGLPTVESETNDQDDEELSDAEHDDESDESLLNDELNLEREEYIVPLPLEGRQSDMYSGYITQHKELLEKFLKDPRSHQPLSEVEVILSYLRAIETHIDLVFAEAESASRTDTSLATQVEFAAQFGMENSAKFRFLHWLTNNLQDHSKHLIIVTEKQDDALFNILGTFCEAKSIDYRMPTKNRRADPLDIQGNMIIDIIPGDGSADNIVLTSDLIICLDGVQDAKHIRQKNWARSPEGDIAPILHLVTPRTVGHIERYISPALDIRERLHTTLASLAQMRGELGKPLDEDTPRARESGELIFTWLIINKDDEGLSWPLPSIGSVKGVIEFQTQLSQASTTTTPPPERSKRPLDEEELDSAKRRRFTPQPPTIPNSIIINNEEVTRVSDSMPGSLADASSLRRQLREMEEAYQTERARREAEEDRFREHEVMWDNQQTVHENLTRDHRLLLGAKKASDEKFETMTKNIETLRERLSVKTAENRQLVEQLEEQRTTHLLSEDEKIASITQLRKDLAAAQEGLQRASKKAQTAEATLEYTKEQYRLAQDAAASAQSTVEQLTAENAQLTHAASGEPAKLKAMHLGRQFENKDRQLRAVSAELGNVKRALGLKEDELTRWKNNIGRVGVGTRAQSVTPQPKVRSRAASPMGGRLSNLRNG